MPTAASADAARLTIYYDGSCPLCTREIAYYRRSPAASALDWVDVSRAVELGPGLDCQSAMRRFHVRDAQGRLHHGAAGFARLWRELPGWRWLGLLCAHPPLSWLAEGSYRLFLPMRPALQRALQRWLARSGKS